MLSHIPNATIKRLALYRRCFVELDEMGVKRIQSGELSQKIGIDSATIRRDFSYLGELGRQGYGYEVRVVLEAFNNLKGIIGTTKKDKNRGCTKLCFNWGWELRTCIIKIF